MPFSERKLSSFFYGYFLLLLIWSFTLFFTHQTTSQWNYFFNLAYAFIYLSGGIIAFLGAKKSGLHNSVGRELFWIGTAVTCYGAGLVLWAYFNVVLLIETPFPSLADFFFVLYTPFLGYSIIHLLSIFGINTSKKIYFQALLIFAISSLFIFSIGNPPDLSSDLPLLTKSLNIYYLLSDSLLITLGLLLIRFTRGKIHKSFFYFLTALFLMTIADFVFSYRSANNTYWNGDISDVVFALAGLMFTQGIIKIVTTQSIILKYLPQKKSD
jgi:hypothetical protein